ncbi:MAG: 30S ribosomal protein S11 [Caldilineaceae bacterium]|nr:30S ribosomal protein S11 [Caldilineaceae bacterium]
MARPTRGARRDKRQVPFGQVHIRATFNNTIVTVTDNAGAVLVWSSSGCNNFSGSRKSTPYAAGLAGQQAGTKAYNEFGVREVHVFVKGPGPGRENALSALVAAKLQILSITDVTPLAHNGCRPPKKRRG